MLVSDHAYKRMQDRVNIKDKKKIRKLALKAWRKGRIYKLKRMTSSKCKLFMNIVWVFTNDNTIKLITIYKLGEINMV